jgi:hypothetical protein
MNVLKLRKLLEGIETQNPSSVQAESWTNEEKKVALEAIGRYNEYGRMLAREASLMEIAHSLSEVAQHAQKFLSEELEGRKKTNDGAWFDGVMPERNMKELSKCSDEFEKYAMEAHVLEQRMQALYEQMGTNLNRYFEIKDLQEGVSPAVSKL